MIDDVAQVRRHLTDIPALMAEAAHYITPGTAPKDPDARHATNIYRIPIVAEIADLLDTREKDIEDVEGNRLNGDRRLGVLPTLGLWVSLAWAELDDMGNNPRQCCTARNHTITGETSWLSDYAEQITQLHPDFPHEIETLWKELCTACRVRRQYKPKCPNCSYLVEAVYGNPEDRDPAWWRCTACGRTWILDAEVQRLALTQPRMTLPQIASLLGIAVRTLYNWRNQGRFTGDRRGLYELDHVRRAAEKLGRISA